MMISHRRLALLGLPLLSFLAPGATTWAQTAQPGDAIAREVQTVNTSDFFDLSDPQEFLDSPDLAFPPGAETLLRRDSSHGGTLVFVRPGAGPDDANPTLEIPETINLAFDGKAMADRTGDLFGLLFFDSTTNELIGVRATSEGALDPAAISRFDAQAMGVRAARGMGFDALSGRLFVLDGTHIVQVEAGALHDFDRALSEGQMETNPLDPALANAGVRGLAVDPANGRLYTYSPGRERLYELSQDGRLLSTRDFSAFDPIDPWAMVFAPSADRTDDSLQTNLYVASEGGEHGDVSAVTEWALVTIQAQPADPPGACNLDATADLVDTIHLKAVENLLLEPPSPDPAGISYIESTDTLLVSDSEVNEYQFYEYPCEPKESDFNEYIPAIFAGDNLFEIERHSGSLLAATTTTAFSCEPTGVAYDKHNDRVFISDDDNDEIYQVTPGKDEQYGTADDDVVTLFSTRDFGSYDPEGLAYDSDGGDLYVVDGVNSEVYRISAGEYGFDGLAPGGDDVVTAFDTKSLGVLDPEGIAYDSDNHLLYVASSFSNRTVAHITKVGTLVRMVGISAAVADKPAGVAFAPSSVKTPLDHATVYVTDRGVDNNSVTDQSDPNESNDGKIYEFSVPPLPSGNSCPGVAAGPDQIVLLSGEATLDGTVTDPDGPLPLPTMWRKLSGPGTVTFADASAVDTTASFSAAGTYVLELLAEDGLGAVRTDQLTVEVLPPPLEIATIYLSGSPGGTIGGDAFDEVSFEDEDVLAFDVAGKTWSLFFDGSAEGLPSAAKIDALHVYPDGRVLMSFNADGLTIPDVGSVDDSDIVRFDPDTGTYELFFDGSVFGLEPATSKNNNHDVDALGFTPDGRLVISTRGTVDLADRKTQDEDLLTFTAAPADDATSGTFGLYFDGQDVGLAETSREDVFGVWIDVNGDVYLTTLGTFSVGDGKTTGDGTDVFVCVPGTLGPATTCGFSLIFDGAENGFTRPDFSVSGLSLVPRVATVERRVDASSDDAEQRFSGSNRGTVSLRSSDLEMVLDGRRNQTVGLRFNDLRIPQGASIFNAYVQFQVDETSTVPTELTIEGENVDNAATFETTRDSIRVRPRTNATVQWEDVPPWETVGAADAEQRTPDIATIVQEIVGRPGWASGNSLAIIITGEGERNAESFDGDRRGAPLLHVEYRAE